MNAAISSRWDGTEYLRKHQLSPLQIDTEPDPGLALVVTIPAHDEPDLLRTLESLCACRVTGDAVEIIRMAISEAPDNQYFKDQLVRFEALYAEQQASM